MSVIITLSATDITYERSRLKGLYLKADHPDNFFLGFIGYAEGQDPEDAVIMYTFGMHEYSTDEGDYFGFNRLRYSLASNLKYYYKGFVRIDGNYTYGDNWISFTTPSKLAGVETLAPQDTTATTVRARGSIDTITYGTTPSVIGGENVTKRGFCYNTTGNPTVANDKMEEEGSYSTGDFDLTITGLLSNQHYYIRAYAYNSMGLAYGTDIRDFTTDEALAEITNIKTEPDSTQTAIKFYGEILSAEEGTIIEKGFEYLIQDEEPTAEATGIEVIKEKPEWIEFWDIGEYWAHEYEGNEVKFEDRLYHLLKDEGYEHDTIWWFRAYCKIGEDKFTAETWMKNVPTVTTSECTEVAAQQAKGNGELTDKGANIVERLGFRIIKEYSGDLMGAQYYCHILSDFKVAEELEEHAIYDAQGIFITGFYWTGIFYRDAFFPKSQTPGDFDLGIYSYVLGGGFLGEEFGVYLKPNDTYKIQAIAKNDLGIGFGDDIFEITTGQNFLYEEDEPVISPTAVEKSVTIRNIPVGAVVTRVGIRLGRTSGCNEIDVFMDGEWGNGEKITFYISDLVPGKKYYEKPYMVLHYVSDEVLNACIRDHWYEVGDLAQGTDGKVYISIVAHYGAPENCPITGENWADYWELYEWEEEIIDDEEEEFEMEELEDEELDDIIPTYEEYNYKTIIREIGCEKISDQSFIDKAGRRRSETITNHLIQDRATCQEVIVNYLNKFQIVKLKVEIEYDIPLPFERQDAILIDDGITSFKPNGEGEIVFKEDGAGESPMATAILAKIRKIDGSFVSGSETILNLELEV